MASSSLETVDQKCAASREWISQKMIFRQKPAIRSPLGCVLCAFALSTLLQVYGRDEARQCTLYKTPKSHR